MARLTTRNIYRDLLLFPRPEVEFDATFNYVEGPNGLQQITIIDTRVCLDRREYRSTTLRSRPLGNYLEGEVVNMLLHRILQHMGEADLVNQIVVASPYHVHAEVVRAHLRGGFCNPRNGAGRHLNVLVESIDALQGSEREVAIITFARSNPERNIGFLCDAARLNVAVTLAKRLLVLVGDFRTLTRSPVLSSIYNSVCRGAPRTRIEFHSPRSSRNVGHAEEVFQQRVELEFNRQH